MQNVEELVDQSYRDQLGTVDKDGKRIWLYPKLPKGKLTQIRQIVAYVLIGVLLFLPWLKVDGHPLFLFDVMGRKFIIFGSPFFPQDFHLLAISLISFFVFVMLFTTIFGRVWCGWTCPQTIFMEHVFRPIEHAIEGKPPQQKRLNEGPWTGEKIWKKGLKHVIFLGFAMLISHSVMAYLVGTDQLLAFVSEGPLAHTGSFFGLMAFTGIFYFVFTYLREQVCVAICPYGRLQGVLLNKESMVVAYDHVRGEQRTRKKQLENEEEGDCIDCGQCVRVCPTGIDIRNGTQLECVNCTACIDACNDIMDKLDREPGLIRIASEENIENKKPFRFTPRMFGYSVVLVALLSLASFMILDRSDIDATILRVPGQLYIKSKDGKTISNLYKVKMANKTFQDHTITFELENPKGEIRIVGDKPLLKSGGTGEAIIFVDIARSDLQKMKNKIKIRVLKDGQPSELTKTNFMAPAPK